MAGVRGNAQRAMSSIAGTGRSRQPAMRTACNVMRTWTVRRSRASGRGWPRRWCCSRRINIRDSGGCCASGRKMRRANWSITQATLSSTTSCIWIRLGRRGLSRARGVIRLPIQARLRWHRKRPMRCRRTAKDRPLVAANSSDRRYMQPINYQRHCASCHHLTLAQAGDAQSGFLNVEVAHAEMEIVREQLAALPALYGVRLARDPKREEKLTITRKVRNKTTQTHISEQEWVQRQIETLGSGPLADWLASPQALEHPDLKAALSPTTNPATTQPVVSPEDQRALYVAYGMTNSCSKCHELRGTLPGSSIVIGDGAATTAPPAAFETKPTGIPSSPRRWFTASQFNHDKHRAGMSCLTCHSAALASSLTMDVLLPDMNSCLGCHHASNSTGRGVAADCTSCHLFHDRTKEGPTAAVGR